MSLHLFILGEIDMRIVNKSFLILQYRVSHKHCGILILFFLIEAFLYSPYAYPTPGNSKYTLDSIADGLLSAEARLSDLRLEYVFTHKAYKKSNGPKMVAKCIYAQKRLKDSPKVLRYLDKKVSFVDPNRKDLILKEDFQVSFDGQATRLLYRRDESGKLLKPMEGYIIADYDKSWFGSYDKDPHTTIWYIAGKQWGQFIKEYKDKFYIEGEAEILNGISTVKLQGTMLTNPKHNTVNTFKIWISPERNFLPLKWQRLRSNGELAWEVELCDLMQLPNGMWYLKTIRTPAEPPGNPDFEIALTYEISEISIDPIPKELFTPEFPPNTHVRDTIQNISYTTY